MPRLTLKELLDLPPNWLVGCLILAWGQTLVLPSLPALPISGWSLVAVGLGFVLLALKAFREAKTTVIPHQSPAALITHGVFAHSRNPIYLADLMFLAGLSLVWGSWLGLILVPVLHKILAVRFIEPEEARLKSQFSANYEAWATRTRRWL